MAQVSLKQASRQTWLLVKNRLLAQTGFNVLRYEKDAKKKSGKLFLAGVVVLLALLGVFYLVMMSMGYAALGLNELTPSLAFIMTSLITLFFTIFKANGELFAFKDYETLSALPLSANLIINSRLLNMYLWNTLFSAVIMLPMGVVYAYFAKVSLLFYPMWLLGILLTSLIPTTLAAVFGAGITAIAQKFKYANVVATVLSFGLIIAILVFSMTINPESSFLSEYFTASGQLNIEAISALVPILQNQIARVYPPAFLFELGIVKLNVGAFLLFAGVSLGIYGLFILILGRYYQKINTALTSQGSRAHYQVKTLEQTSRVAALYRKTIMRILKSTSLVTNALMGCVMTLIAAIAFMSVGPDQLLGSLTGGDDFHHLVSIAPFVIAGLAAMTNTTSISLALEGKSIWLIKSLPIQARDLYLSYLLVNLTFTVPTVLISGLLVGLALHATLLEILVIVVISVVLVGATGVFGLVIGNRLAYYDWESETHLVKQSMMSMIGMLGSVLGVAFIGVVVNVPTYPVSALPLTIVVSLLLFAITWLVFQKEAKRAIK